MPQLPSELHCAVSDSDESLALAANTLGMTAAPRTRPGQTLLLAEVDAAEAEPLVAAVTAAGLHPTLVPSQPKAEFRRSIWLFVLVLLGRNVAAILGPGYERYGLSTLVSLGTAEVVIWALVMLLVALLAQRFFRADVTPRWRRPVVPPRELDPAATRWASWAAVAATVHAAVCIHAGLTTTPLHLTSSLMLGYILTGGALNLVAYGILRLILLARGGATGAARCLAMLLVAYAVDLALALLASGRGLGAFPWYGVPILRLALVPLSYPMLRALVLSLLYLTLSYALRRIAQPTQETRLMGHAAFAAGIGYAVLGTYAPLLLALFDVALVAYLLPRAQSHAARPRPARATA